jgi:hypothetical protein
MEGRRMDTLKKREGNMGFVIEKRRRSNLRQLRDGDCASKELRYSSSSPLSSSFLPSCSLSPPSTLLLFGLFLLLLSFGRNPCRSSPALLSLHVSSLSIFSFFEFVSPPLLPQVSALEVLRSTVSVQEGTVQGDTYKLGLFEVEFDEELYLQSGRYCPTCEIPSIIKGEGDGADVDLLDVACACDYTMRNGECGVLRAIDSKFEKSCERIANANKSVCAFKKQLCSSKEGYPNVPYLGTVQLFTSSLFRLLSLLPSSSLTQAPLCFSSFFVS